MKKLSSTVICLLCLSLFSSAQSFHFGIKAGANLQKIEGVPFKDKFTFGYQAGAFATVGVTSKFAIQPEVLFSSTTVDSASNFSTVYGFKQVDKIKLNYLDIPVLLNIKPFPLITIQAGPQFSIMLDKNKSLLKNGEAAFKNGNVSAVAGLQLNLPKIKVYGRYTTGLKNLNNVNNNNDWKNRNIQVGLGFQIL